MLYGMNPPKMSGGVIFFRDIVICSMVDNEINGAVMYTNGVSSPVATTDIKNLSYKQKQEKVRFVDLEELLDTDREFWVYKTEKEALIQKLICLDILKNEYIIREKRLRAQLNKSIPESVSELCNKMVNDNPEYFL